MDLAGGVELSQIMEFTFTGTRLEMLASLVYAVIFSLSSSGDPPYGVNEGSNIILHWVESYHLFQVFKYLPCCDSLANKY